MRTTARLTVVLALALHATHGRDIYHHSRGFDNVEYRPPANPDEATAEYWAREAAGSMAARLGGGWVGEGSGEVAKNVVLFIGDGMSAATVGAARALLGQRGNRTGEEGRLAFDDFPTVGLVKTYCVDAQTADSACSATAYLCGVKANYGTLGVTAGVRRGDCGAAGREGQQVESIAAWALHDGRDAGIVTTTRVTHASPAGAYAHSADRDWESDADLAAACPDPTERQHDIANQLIHSYPGNQFKVILGGGRREFLPNTTIDEEGSPGRRLDGRDLLYEWQNMQTEQGRDAKYVWHRDQLLDASRNPPDALLGLFESSHMQYHLEADPISEPTLAELTEAAIKVLSRNPRGFFLFVEGGRIDLAHHDNYPRLALDETIELSRAVQRATELLDPRESLVMVTSDHGHVMTYNGYARRGADVLGPSNDVDDDGVPYMTLSYANGPGVRSRHPDGRRDDPTQYDYTDTRHRYEAGVPLDLETHGGEDVAVFAWGVRHALLGGVQEQSGLPRRAAAAACLGPGPHLPACAQH